MMLKTAIAGTNSVEVLTSCPRTRAVSFPNRPVKITRNISGKANVKKAAAGFRQNALFV